MIQSDSVFFSSDCAVLRLPINYVVAINLSILLQTSTPQLALLQNTSLQLAKIAFHRRVKRLPRTKGM